MGDGEAFRKVSALGLKSSNCVVRSAEAAKIAVKSLLFSNCFKSSFTRFQGDIILICERLVLGSIHGKPEQLVTLFCNCFRVNAFSF